MVFSLARQSWAWNKRMDRGRPRQHALHYGNHDPRALWQWPRGRVHRGLQAQLLEAGHDWFRWISWQHWQIGRSTVYTTLLDYFLMKIAFSWISFWTFYVVYTQKSVAHSVENARNHSHQLFRKKLTHFYSTENYIVWAFFTKYFSSESIFFVSTHCVAAALWKQNVGLPYQLLPPNNAKNLGYSLLLVPFPRKLLVVVDITR